MISKLFGRLTDLIAPRSCAVCGYRLAPGERVVCTPCNLHLPRTDHLARPYDNEMAKTFWGRIRHMEKAAALIYHEAGSQASNPIYALKYHHRPELGTMLGRMLGQEMAESGFWADIDLIVPVPLSPDRRRERGYNQSERIALGLSEVCGKPVLTDVLTRRDFRGSQTTKGRWERNANVAGAFALRNTDKIKGAHLLLVDDIVTTGATICACAAELERVEGVRISVAALGFVDPRR